jgi:N-sulfoglucosamine sulfohydrolase
MRRILCGLLVVGFFAFGSTPARAADARPNILWIFGDDLGPDLSCYGNAAVRTPNLDKLAAEGVRFTRAHVTGPVCSASRSALITGMYQTSIGAHHHRSHRQDGYHLPDGVCVITDVFREAGYYTANIKTITPRLKAAGKTDFNFTLDRPPFDGDDWAELKSHQPFYAQVNFTEPHRGPAWPAARRRTDIQRVDPAKVVLPPYYPDTPLARDDYANYLDAVQALDAKVGVVLKKLEEDGLAQNTVVVFLGDNGRCHVRDKQWCYDGGTHIPLIIRWPGHVQPGSVRQDLVIAIDVSAMSVHLAGIPLPPKMQGRVILGPGAVEPRQYVVTARDRCDETVDRIRCVRGTRYSYIRNFRPELPWTQPNRYKETQYPVLNQMKQLHAEGKLTPVQAQFMAPRKPEEELYDLEADPHEVHNLAASPEHQAVLKEMRATLQKWIEETGDQGEKPESPESRKGGLG